MTDTPEKTCQDIAQRLRAGGAIDGAYREHAQDCEVCSTLLDRELASALGAFRPAASGETAASFTALTADLESTAGWRTRLMEWSRPARAALMGSAALVICLAVAATTLREDFAAYPAVRMGAVLATFGVVMLGAIHESLRPLYRPSRSLAQTWGTIVSVLGLGVVVAALPIAHTSVPAALEGLGASLIPRAARCLAFGAAVGAPLLLLGGLVDRVRPPRWSTTLLAAGAAGLLGNAALQLHCPIVHQEHLLLGHATVTAVLLAVNVVLYRWLA